MHVPVNRPVIIQLSSKDVIHSFGVPAMRVKQDAIPGLRHAGLVHADGGRATFEIACSQLCGLGHYRMRGVITVESRRRVPEVPGRRSRGCKSDEIATVHGRIDRRHRIDARDPRARTGRTLVAVDRSSPDADRPRISRMRRTFPADTPTASPGREPKRKSRRC